MRKQFPSVRILFAVYHDLKLKHENPASNFPSADRFQAVIQLSHAAGRRAAIEEERAFLGDVGIFLDERRGHLNWWEAFILRARIGVEGKARQHLSYAAIAWKLKKDPRCRRGIPKHPQHVWRACEKLLERAGEYFLANEYLEEEPEKPIN